jgi:uncharacterized protein with PIN domain
VETVQHVSEDDLENYAMRTLPATEVESLEEHFLICSECRDRLQATDEYVAAMRAAAQFRGRDRRVGRCERCRLPTILEVQPGAAERS